MPLDKFMALMWAIQRDCQLVQYGNSQIPVQEAVKRRFVELPRGQIASTVPTLTFFSISRQSMVPAQQVFINLKPGTIRLGDDEYRDVLFAQREENSYGGDIANFQTIAQLIRLGDEFNCLGVKYKAMEVYIPQTGGYYSL